MLEKFNALSGELAVEGKSPILTYIEFLDEFLGSLKKILKEETINKIDSFCQDTLYGLVQKELLSLESQFHSNQESSSSVNESLYKMKGIFGQTIDYLKPEYYLSCVLHQST